MRHPYILFFLKTAIILLLFCSCRKILQLQDPDRSPPSIFTEAWTVIDQRYALFPVKQTDWSQTRNAFEQQTTGNISESALFKVLTDMLATLQDGHVSLLAGNKTYTYDNFYTDYLVNFNYNNLINNYLKNNYHQSGPVIYSITDNVGYLYYQSFENDITNLQLDTVFSFMKNTKGLIVDIRSNTGGGTQNIRLLFQRFLTARKLVDYEIKKKGREHNDFDAPEALFIEGTADPYLQPVCVLTNRSCFSACNDFALFMSQLPNVQLVGDTTGGGGGIPARYILANGWTLQYTATMTVSPDHQPIERGIPPSIMVDIGTLEEEFGKDPILEKAFSILK